MDLSVIIVVAVGTLLFVGFAVWGAFYSRQQTAVEQIQLGQPEQRAKAAGETKSD